MKAQTLDEIRDQTLAYQQYLIAFAGLMVWDWLILLPKEYRHIYRAKCTFLKVCYLLNRYGALLLGSTCTVLILAPVSPSACRKIFWLDITAVVFTILITDVLLMIRVYAIYERSRRTLIVLCAGFTIEAALVIAAGTQLGPIEITRPIADYIGLRGCLASQWHKGGRAQLLWFLSLVPLIVNTSLLGATLYRLWRIKQITGRNMPLMERLWRGGLQYFAVVFCFNIANFFFYVQPNYVLNSFNAGANLVCTSSAGCRLSLDLFEGQREGKFKADLAPISVDEPGASLVAPSPRREEAGDSRVSVTRR
ncbi:hypothetical protein JCM11491_001546 [Sporobolomyces phaffii]